MTSETKQTEAGTDTETLRRRIDGVRVVLWDFDGPICRLFARHSAARIADDLVRWLEGRGLHELLGRPERESGDPQALLRAFDRARPGDDRVRELEELLTQEEIRATGSALPTPYTDPLIRTWTAVGARQAVATNNSPRAVTGYLAARGLLPCFAPHIYGRGRQVRHLKPDPHTLESALRATEVPPSAAVFIGDSAVDHEAARRAGVPFLGYARDEDTERELRNAGADAVVGSFAPLLTLLRQG
ncbi:HAD family hydrolase [Streptomyces ziwulingensis]|uniref:HAD family hydrolase n=1 Tax=Streptomyces ziwulingensis TaxID=1045501 RepID=A0ABP9AXR4_9ACTN